MSQLTHQKAGNGPSDDTLCFTHHPQPKLDRDSPTFLASTARAGAAVAMQQQQQSFRLPPLQINTAKPAGAFPLTDCGDKDSNPSTTPTSGRSHRKPTTPSPLQSTTAASDDFYNSSTTYDSLSLHASIPHIANAGPQKGQSLPVTTIWRTQLYIEQQSSNSTTTSDEPQTLPLFRRIPHDTQSAHDTVRPSTQPEGSQAWPAITMAGPRMEAAKGAPRNSSIDSAISAISTSSHSHKNLKSSTESPAGPSDIGNLIKAAGSAEAVIQYLLKEKSSQAQQNSQLWRLVDKQRAMILGLNKDLERALKDKEKYRKKLKEVLAAPQVPPLPRATSSERSMTDPTTTSRTSPPQLQKLDVPLSPALDSDSQRHSPIEVALAPYPITPPADQPNGPPTAVREMLDPTHSMPKAHEHALDQYDHEAEEREAEDARKAAEELEIPIHLAMPPTRSPPSEPPRMPPPKPPIPSMTSGDGLSQFPLPPAPPPRKPPPAPIQIQTNVQTSTDDDEADVDSGDSDLDGLIGVAKGSDSEKRGRRRTREEDEHDREITALKEAERRSLSKKSNKSTTSSKGTPRENLPVPSLPASPRNISNGLQVERPSMLTILSADERDSGLPPPPPLLSPGLPSSPRPFAVGLAGTTINSPPLSPRHLGAFASAPLSPRPPRQPIPLPLNTPQQTPPSESNELKSPRPLNIVKKAMDALTATSPTKYTSSRDSPVGEAQVYTGFITEEHPDLLLPPNALLSIEVKVASSRMKPSRASLLSLTQLEEDPVFTLAVLSRGQGTELWRVEKDSVSLAKLDQRLKQCPAFTAKTPDRSLFSGHAPAKLDARRMALEQYLDELLNTPLDTETAVELCRYLSTNTLPANADETGVAIPRPDSQPQKTGPGGRPFRTGYLTKRGKNFGGWKARFFMLEGPQLRYYETPGGAHLGTIKLQKAQIGKQSAPQNNETCSPSSAAGGSEEMDNQYRHAFLILEPKKKDPSSMTKHVLCAESDTERDQWVDALLRWIDYRDPEEEEAKKKEMLKKESKQMQTSDARLARSNSKQKKSSSRPQKQQESEPLIAVNYEATQQGEIPHSAPSRKGSAGPNYDQPCPTPMGMSSQQSFAASGYQNPQPISDSPSWGSRAGGGGGGGGLVPPDEKKIRKRSFFGFATKQPRGSSDGNDSLFGGDSNSGPGASSGSHPTGPFRNVFGAPLAEAVRHNAPFDVKVPLPAVVYRCIQYLEANNALNEEGIFRLSGSNVVIKQLRERFNLESDVNLVTDEAYHDIHAVASLLKLYLRELPTTILTRDLHMHFVSVTEMPNSSAKIAALNELVDRLPTANATLLKYLIAFLIRIINKSNINKMTVRNVGIVFSPTLNIPAPVFAMFLQNYEGIFGIDAEQYELPSQRDPMAEQQRCYDDDARSIDMNAMPMQRPAGPRRPSMASIEQARPMTSGQSGSPHRQRLAEQERQRSSPEPRIGLGQLSNSQLRSTPTPPGQQQQQQPPQQVYEPQYLAQQGYQGFPTGSNRPAYEGGFAMPQHYDMSQLQTPVGPRMVNPGYDRPLYEGGPAAVSNPGYDAYNPGSARSNRRESMLMGGAMMGGLNSQGSRSRLNQETHY